MLIGNTKNDTTQIKVPIENYANNLVMYMMDYLNIAQSNMQSISENDDEKAKIFLRWIIFPNKKRI